MTQSLRKPTDVPLRFEHREFAGARDSVSDFREALRSSAGPGTGRSLARSAANPGVERGLAEACRGVPARFACKFDSRL
jgi:hypothetical protein